MQSLMLACGMSDLDLIFTIKHNFVFLQSTFADVEDTESRRGCSRSPRDTFLESKSKVFKEKHQLKFN